MSNTWRDIPKPMGVDDLPVDDRGFPIPFVALVSDGRPDFTTIDAAKIMLCITESCCGICGLSLMNDVHGFPLDEDTKVAFIGGPNSIEHGNFLDPPMHEWCASYAMAVCPHIAIDTSRYSKPKNDGIERLEYAGVDPNRPERFGMLVVKAIDVLLLSIEGQPMFTIDPSGEREVRWQDEPQLDEDGRELTPYWETRYYQVEAHDHDSEPCIDTSMVTTGRHRKDTGLGDGSLVAVMCPGCGVVVKLNRVTDPDEINRMKNPIEED